MKPRPFPASSQMKRRALIQVSSTFGPSEKLGVELINKKTGGVIAKHVHTNSPAKRKGISKGMSLVSVNGTPTSSMSVNETLAMIENRRQQGNEMKFTFSKRISLLWPKSRSIYAEAAFNLDGIDPWGIELVSSKGGRGGVFVRHIIPGSPAERQGLKCGMKMLHVGGMPVKDLGVNAILALIKERKKKSTISQGCTKIYLGFSKPIRKVMKTVIDEKENICDLSKKVKKRSINIVLEKNKNLGVELKPKIKNDGLIVVRVLHNSPAQKYGVRKGMILESINGIVLSSTEVAGDDYLRFVEKKITQSKECHFVFRNLTKTDDQIQKICYEKTQLRAKARTERSEMNKYKLLYEKGEYLKVSFSSFETKHGIGLVLAPSVKGDGYLVKSVISPVAMQKGIRRGMLLIKINNEPIEKETFAHIAMLLQFSFERQSFTDLIFQRPKSITRQIYDRAFGKMAASSAGKYITITVSDKTKSIGIELSPSVNCLGGLLVKRVLPNADESVKKEIRKGMRLISINGNNVQLLSLAQVQKFIAICLSEKLKLCFLRESSSRLPSVSQEKCLKIMASKQNWSRVDVTFQKASSIGIQFMSLKSGGIVVNQILRDSQAYRSSLVQKGMLLVAVDGFDVSTLSLQKILKMISEKMLTVSDEKYNISFTFKKIVSARTLSPQQIKRGIKDLIAAKLGETVKLTLKRGHILGIVLIPKQKGGVMISSLKGLHISQQHRTKLRKGMTLLSINGVSHRYSDLQNVLGAINESDECELLFQKAPVKRITDEMKDAYADRRRIMYTMIERVHEKRATWKNIGISRVAQNIALRVIQTAILKGYSRVLTKECINRGAQKCYLKHMINDAIRSGVKVQVKNQRQKFHFPSSYGLWHPVPITVPPKGGSPKNVDTNDSQVRDETVLLHTIEVDTQPIINGKQDKIKTSKKAKMKDDETKNFQKPAMKDDKTKNFQMPSSVATNLKAPKVLEPKSTINVYKRLLNPLQTMNVGDRWWLEARSKEDIYDEKQLIEEQKQVEKENSKSMTHAEIIKPVFELNKEKKLNPRLILHIPVLRTMSNDEISRIRRLPKISEREQILLKDFLGDNKTNDTQRNHLYSMLKRPAHRLNTEKCNNKRPQTALNHANNKKEVNVKRPLSASIVNSNVHEHCTNATEPIRTQLMSSARFPLSSRSKTSQSFQSQTQEYWSKSAHANSNTNLTRHEHRTKDDLKFEEKEKIRQKRSITCPSLRVRERPKSAKSVRFLKNGHMNRPHSANPRNATREQHEFMHEERHDRVQYYSVVRDKEITCDTAGLKCFKRPHSANEYMTPKNAKPKRPNTAIGLRQKVEDTREELEKSLEKCKILKKNRMASVRNGLKIVPRESFQHMESLIPVVFSQAAKLLKRTMEKLIQTRLNVSMKQWKSVNMQMIVDENLRAVALLQRLARRWATRRELRIRISLRKEQNIRERLIYKKHTKMAVLIQAFYRGYCSRKKMGWRASMMRQLAHNSATILQTRGRILIAIRLRLNLVTLKFKRIDASSAIQRVFRGYKGRQKASLQQRIKAAEMLVFQRELNEKDRSRFFRMIGAAKTISEWWQCRLLLFQTRLRIKLHKRKMAARIQRFARQLIAHQKVFRLRIIHRNEKRRVNQAAAKIQCGTYRAWKARVKYRHLKSEKNAANQAMQRRRKRKKKWAWYLKYTPLVMYSAGKTILHETNKALNPWSYGNRYWAAVTIQKHVRKTIAKHYFQRKRIQDIRDRRQRLQKCAMDIQRVWRGKLYGRQQYRHKKNVWAVTTIQRYHRGFIVRYKQKLNWAATFLQKLWRGEIQSRKFRDNKLFMKKLKNIKLRCAHIIQSFFLRLYWARKKSRLIQTRRILEEERLAGCTQFATTQMYIMDDLVAGSVHSGNGFLRDVYNSQCKAYGQLRGPQFKNLFVELRSMTEKLKVSRIDIIFSKYKQKQKDFMTYQGFLKALYSVAKQLFPNVVSFRAHNGDYAQLLKLINDCIFPCKLASRAFEQLIAEVEKIITIHTVRIQRRFRGSPTFVAVLIARKKEETREIRFRKVQNLAAVCIQRHYRGVRARGKQKIIIQSIYTKFVFTELVKIDDFCGYENNFFAAVRYRGEDLVLNFARPNFGFINETIPWSFRNVRGDISEKFILACLKKWCDENGVNSNLLKAPIEPTTYDKGSRVRLFDLVKEYNIPCYSLTDLSLNPPSTLPNHYRVKSVYWYDKRSGAKLWVRPKIFNTIGDIPAIIIPEKREAYDPKCNFCISWRAHDDKQDVHLASRKCVECDEVFCSFCYDKSHMFTSKNHRYEELKLCETCHHHVATRTCFACDPNIQYQCDSCFHSHHANIRVVMLPFEKVRPTGGSRYGDGAHKWAAIVMPCSECNMFAAQWECEICGIFCHQCLNKIHRTGKRSMHEVNYIGAYYTVQKYLRKSELLDCAKEKAKREEKAALNKLNEFKLKQMVVSKLQAIWRAKLVRRAQRMTEVFMRLKNRRDVLQRHDEQMLRIKPSFRVLNGIGMAPILKTDSTPVKKQKHMTVLNQESVGRMVDATVAKLRRTAKADILLPGSVEIGKESDIAWTTIDLREHLEHGDTIRIGTFLTSVDSLNRAFNSRRLPLRDFWDRPNADCLPVYKVLSIDQLHETYMSKPKSEVEQKVEEINDTEEEDRKKKLMKEAKYMGEISLWDTESHEVLNDETGEFYTQTVYINKLTGLSQIEKPKCFVKLEEERLQELEKVKKEAARKREKRLASRGGVSDRKRRLQRGRAAIAVQEEEDQKAREAANLTAMLSL
jgi:C-terminal processing protease CtpA/Prc